ncbi:MAG: GAF domain-containing protein [Bacteroidales bacterium]
MEKLEIKGGSKIEIYESVIPQIQSLIEGEEDLIANLANIAAALKEAFNHLWIGFYIVRADKEGLPAIAGADDNTGQTDNLGIGKTLVLGPFQGPIACTRIKFGKGVCGTAWKEKRTLIVPDVDQFPGHIACSSLSKSEIVIPIIHDGEVVAVLDIDSVEYNTFDETDAQYLEKIFDKNLWSK